MGTEQTKSRGEKVRSAIWATASGLVVAIVLMGISAFSNRPSSADVDRVAQDVVRVDRESVKRDDFALDILRDHLKDARAEGKAQAVFRGRVAQALGIETD